jgi:hypothetical protein
MSSISVRFSRFQICRQCTYSRKSSVLGVPTTTCGRLDLTVMPPIVGETVVHEGKEIKLCGCAMKVKVFTPGATCPANKW